MPRLNAFYKLVISAALLAFSTANAQLNEYSKLNNDKELISTHLSSAQVERLISNYSSYYADTLFELLTVALDQFNARERACDLGLAEELDGTLQSRGIKQDSYKEYFAVLRAHNKIDDIFYDILTKTMDLYLKLNAATKEPLKVDKRLLLITPKVLKRNDVASLYSDFKSWPDEDSTCSLGAYYGLAKQAANSKGKISKRELKILNTKAYKEGEISSETYMKLQVLASSEALDWPIYIGGYQDKIRDAKNVMQYTEPLPLDEDTERFSTKYVKRRKNLTRRKSLYYKYNATQIVMLAQVLEKASMRMGIDPNVETSTPEITTNYVMLRDGSTFTETYELSPAEQFEFARKRLRMDIMELSSSKTFAGKEIEYEDVIMAALETGHISHHDIEFVIKYDDLWNPDISPWKKYKDYALSFVGTAAFYLPPPWNVVGAVGLVFINTKLSSKKGHEGHENPANIFN